MAKKRSRLFLFSVAALIIVIVMALIIYLGTQASQGVVGVKAGDEFIYDIMGFWDSDDPNATLFEYYAQLNMTDWYKITVTEVNGSKVSISTTWRFTNETEFNGTSTVNVETGIVYPTDAFWAIYPSNLKKDDLIRPLGAGQATINETTNRDYAGSPREINRVSLVLQYYDADDPTYSTTWTEYMNTHFDRKTGMLVEFSDRSIYTNPELTVTLEWKLVESNVWTVS